MHLKLSDFLCFSSELQEEMTSTAETGHLQSERAQTLQRKRKCVSSGGGAGGDAAETVKYRLSHHV